MPDRYEASSAVDAAVDPHRAVDQRAQHVEIDVGEALEVEASLAGLVRPQPRDQLGVPVLEPARQVQDEVRLAGRETDERRVAFVPAGVPVVVAAEPDDAGAPHHRRLPGDIGQQRADGDGVRSPGLVLDRGEERRDIGAGRPGLLR